MKKLSLQEMEKTKGGFAFLLGLFIGLIIGIVYGIATDGFAPEGNQLPPL